jgi:hypothetical protein
MAAHFEWQNHALILMVMAKSNSLFFVTQSTSKMDRNLQCKMGLWDYYHLHFFHDIAQWNGPWEHCYQAFFLHKI